MTIEEIVKKFNLNPLVAKVLVARGTNTKKEIDNLLNASFEDLSPLENLPNIEKIAKKIKTHALFGDKIMIFGDYDADGIGSITILYRALKRLGKYVNVDWIVGNRYKDGYGLSKRVINECIKKNIDLLITLDCGISNRKEIKYAKDNGIEVIVIDHHEKDEEDLPECDFVDLKIRKGDYTFDQLCACGATWRVAQYILDDDLYDLIDIVTLSTVADMVPLLGENRIIVKEGIKKIKEGNINTGISELMYRKEIKNEELKTHHFGFKICPMINAVGRLGSAKPAVDILISDDEKKIATLGYKLLKKNEERQDLTKKHLQKAIERVKEDDNIIIYKDKISPGIVGIVAGDLKEFFNKPAIVLSCDENSKELKGSCRSINPLSMYALLKECSDLLNTFGGHKMAAGLSIDADNLEEFTSRLCKLTEGIEYEEIKYDLKVCPTKMTKELIKDIDRLVPFGMGNPKPKFYYEDLRAKSVKKSRSGEHLMFKVEGIDCIAFGAGDKYNLCKNNTINIIYQPDINTYNGKTSLQLKVKKIVKKE